jgi:hypothetical protein
MGAPSLFLFCIQQDSHCVEFAFQLLNLFWHTYSVRQDLFLFLSQLALQFADSSLEVFLQFDFCSASCIHASIHTLPKLRANTFLYVSALPSEESLPLSTNSKVSKLKLASIYANTVPKAKTRHLVMMWLKLRIFGTGEARTACQI